MNQRVWNLGGAEVMLSFPQPLTKDQFRKLERYIIVLKMEQAIAWGASSGDNSEAECDDRDFEEALKRLRATP